MTMKQQEIVNYSKYTEKRISKLAHMNDNEKKELLKTLTASDDNLRVSTVFDKTKKSFVSSTASTYLRDYDKHTNEELAIARDNELGSRPSDLLEDSGKKEYLVKMFFTLEQRHKNYEQEKLNYTPEQLAVVNKIEKESGGQVKIIVDTNFLKAFGKITGVDYRGAGVLGKRVIVGDSENLTRESLLRHEAIHCAQQRDMGFQKWLGLSFIDSKVKQFLGPQKGTASAVDYGTDNQATDLETYMNQYNPNYLPNRQKNDHKKYYDKEFLKSEFKHAREKEFEDMKKSLSLLENKQKIGINLSFQELHKIKTLSQDIRQFENMLDHLENDTEIRTVLVEPDVLPSKSNINSKQYDEKAQVWTESLTNQNKRLVLEENLYQDTLKKLHTKEETLQTFSGTEKEKILLEKEIQEYKKFLQAIKGDNDKSRSKMKQERKDLLEKRKAFEEQKKNLDKLIGTKISYLNKNGSITSGTIIDKTPKGESPAEGYIILKTDKGSIFAIRKNELESNPTLQIHGN